MSRFLQFWCKLFTRRIVNTCLFRFLRDYYGDSLNVTFPQFPNDFLPFPMVFPHVSPSVSTISSCVSTVSPHCVPRFLFQILRIELLCFDYKQERQILLKSRILLRKIANFTGKFLQNYKQLECKILYF